MLTGRILLFILAILNTLLGCLVDGILNDLRNFELDVNSRCGQRELITDAPLRGVCVESLLHIE